MKQTNSKISYILYARKSSEEDNRQMLSLDSQENVLKDIVVREGLHIVEVLRESRSAKEPEQRPVFAEMVKMIKTGKANGILCWKMDRLARNPVDEGLIKYLLQSGRIQNIKTPERDYRPGDNALIASVEFGMANQYIRDLSTNVKRGLYAKAEKGLFPTLAPIGYVNCIYDPKGTKRIIKDPKRWHLVRKMFDLILDGNHTPVQVWRIATQEWGLTTKWGKLLGRSTAYTIFTNPVYYGLFEYPAKSGKWHKGIHEPIITPEEYDRVQVVLGIKGKPRPHKHIFSFSGLMKCGNCGAMITAQHATKRQKNGNIHRYIYYRCTKHIDPNCTEKCLEERILLKQIKDVVSKIHIPPEFHKWVMAKITEDIKNDKIFNTEVLGNKEQKAKNIDKQLDNLLNLVSRQIISEENYVSKKAELLREKARLGIDGPSPEDKTQALISKAKEDFDFARDCQNELESGDKERCRRIISKLGSNPSIKGRIFSICIKKVLLAMETLSKEVKAIHSRLKPAKVAENSRKFELLYAQNPVVRGRWDLNPRSAP